MTSATKDPTALLDHYVATWNEADPGRRREMVSRLYADHGRIVTPSLEVSGREAVLEHIGEVFAAFIGSSERRFRVTVCTGHHRTILLRWELAAAADLAAGSGLNVLLLGLDGRIEADHQFQEPLPESEPGGPVR